MPITLFKQTKQRRLSWLLRTVMRFRAFLSAERYGTDRSWYPTGNKSREKVYSFTVIQQLQGIYKILGELEQQIRHDLRNL